MSNENKNQQNPETPESDEDIKALNEAADATMMDGNDDDALDDVSRLEAEVADLKDKLLRQIAEGENVRRRAERQVGEASAYAVTSFARELLSVSDNLRRALEALPAEMKANDTLKTFVDGVEMTERELLNAFDKAGIKKLSPMGEAYDHNYHQAMFEVETTEQKPGTVVQVVQDGYVIKERLLRPAMVGVAKLPKAVEEGVDETA